MKRKAVTIKDVASHAGISFQTVSLVLNHPERVNEKTRSRVTASMQELGFVPNLAARQLKKMPSNTVACVILTSSGRPLEHGRVMLQDTWQHSVLTAFAYIADRHGFGMLQQSASPEEVVETIQRIYQEGRVDGIILPTPIDDEDVLLRLHEQGIPLVIFGNIASRLHYVTQDDRGAARNVVRQLLARGCRRLGFVRGVGETLTYSAGRERYLGYLEGLREHGLAHQDHWTATGNMSLVSGHRAAHDLFGDFSPQHAGDFPDALIIANDRMAIGALRGLYELGVRIPQDVSVVGFDNFEYDRYTIPTLSSVEGPTMEMAEFAFETLLDLTISKHTAPKLIQKVFGTELIFRDSVRAAPVQRPE